MEKIPVKLLDFALNGGRLERVVFDEFLRTLQFLWKSGMFGCLNDYNVPDLRLVWLASWRVALFPHR